MPTNIVFSHMTIVFSFNDFSLFAILNSSIHSEWIKKYCCTIGASTRYIPSDGFQTFPMPSKIDLLEKTGLNYYNNRQFVLENRHESITQFYNRMHNPEEKSKDIIRLRELHKEMDILVAKAYEWDDLDLNHAFYETKQGLRYTISPEARDEVLDRLLELNHERYAEEIAQGLHDKKKKTKGKKKAAKPKTDDKKDSPQLSLF